MSEDFPDRLHTIKEAAFLLGLKYWQLQRAVKAKKIPSYTPFNARRLVRLSEVNAYIQSTRSGGAR